MQGSIYQRKEVWNQRDPSLRTCAKDTLRHINTNIHTHRFIHTQMKDIHKHRLVYVYMYTGIHIVYTCPQMFTCIHIYSLAYIYVHIDTHAVTHHTYTSTHVHETHIVTHARTCKHIYTLTYVHNAHIYTEKERQRQSQNKRRESGMAQWLRFWVQNTRVRGLKTTCNYSIIGIWCPLPSKAPRYTRTRTYTHTRTHAPFKKKSINESRPQRCGGENVRLEDKHLFAVNCRIWGGSGQQRADRGLCFTKWRGSL